MYELLKHMRFIVVWHNSGSGCKLWPLDDNTIRRGFQALFVRSPTGTPLPGPSDGPAASRRSSNAMIKRKTEWKKTKMMLQLSTTHWHSTEQPMVSSDTNDADTSVESGSLVSRAGLCLNQQVNGKH
ncbi:hypothetical protein BDR07DRAFT_1464104 [Suillus spraguei]|nr:hypothetical protein BDR07DRAFT_1464104 [Suillus spraguei]